MCSGKAPGEHVGAQEGGGERLGTRCAGEINIRKLCPRVKSCIDLRRNTASIKKEQATIKRSSENIF